MAPTASFWWIRPNETVIMPVVTGAITSSWVSFGMTFMELILLIFVYPWCFNMLERHSDMKKA